MRFPALVTLLRWLTVAVILRVLATIVANYPDYFPPDFDSLFLQGREETFAGTYRHAFYLHILTAPIVLVLGLLLLSPTLLRRSPRTHRWLGRVHVLVLLGCVLPSSLVMSRHAFTGWTAGISFVLLSIATATCAILGVVQARRRRFASHRRWMQRSYVLICSAVVLRLISGAIGLLEVSNAEAAYIVAAWGSWLVPLAVFETAQTVHARSRMRRFV